MDAAIEMAESGHLVIGTLHTKSCAETLDRIILFFGLDLLFLGIYAICWQQMIKIFPLSVAYANRAMALLWSAVWAKIIFGENILRFNSNSHIPAKIVKFYDSAITLHKFFATFVP